MRLAAEQLIVGIVSGSILVLLALGLNLIFGFLGVVNFAHGAFFALGAYVAFYLAGALGSFWWGLLLAPVGMMAIGAVVERALLKPLYSRGELDTLLLTFGLTFIATEGITLLAGANGKAVATPAQLAVAVPMGLVSYPAYPLFVVGVTILLVLGLWLLVSKTDLGLVVRAGTRDAVMVEALGFDLTKFRTLIFGLGVAVAGGAGVLSSPMTGVYPDMGSDILILSFVVVAVGGLGSFWGSVVSGLLIGLIGAMTTLYSSTYASIVPFFLMIVVMAFRPRGLFGVR